MYMPYLGKLRTLKITNSSIKELVGNKMLIAVYLSMTFSA